MNDYAVLVEWQGETKYWEKALSNCHFVNHKSQMESSRDQTLPSTTWCRPKKKELADGLRNEC